MSFTRRSTRTSTRSGGEMEGTVTRRHTHAWSNRARQKCERAGKLVMLSRERSMQKIMRAGREGGGEVKASVLKKSSMLQKA